MSQLPKRDSAVYPGESKWTVSEGKHGTDPIYVRLNSSAAQLMGHPDFRFRVGIAAPFNSPTKIGLPRTDEIAQLDAIEDALCARLESLQMSLHVLTITTRGMREFVFYTQSPSEAASAITGLRERMRTHELQSYVEEDPHWSLFDRFSSA